MKLFLKVGSYLFIIVFIFVACRRQFIAVTTDTSPVSIINPPLASPTVLPAYTIIPGHTPTPTTVLTITNAIAFVVGDWQNHGPDDLWVANLDGSGEKKILDNINQVVSQDHDFRAIVAWSPDGQWLAVNRHKSVWIISSDGRNLREVVNFGEKITSITYLKWLPDNERIVFEVFDSQSDVDSFGILDITTGNIGQTTKGFVDSVSPDGQWIAFVTLPLAIKALNVSNGVIVSLNYGKFCRGVGGGLVWSPTSDRLAIWEFGNGRFAHGTVCMVDLKGGGATLTTEGVSSYPSWRPNGEGLYIGVVNFLPDMLGEVNHDSSGLFYFDKRGQFIKDFGYSKEIGRNLESLQGSPNGQWLSSNRQISGKERENFYFINLDANYLITHTINITKEVVTSGDSYYWANDSQSLIFAIGEYYTPDGIGVNHYGSFYSLDIDTGNLIRITNDHWVKSQVLSPKSN